ncbi:MAG: hypothetical protein JST79_19825 [Acidobacteria bacterium]|nr:hypothetical protein [Acidobacteriota bacterium]
MSDELKLLVEWSSPWEEFLSSVRPALAHSEQRLAGEANLSLFPYRGMLLVWGLEIFLLLIVIFLPAKLATIKPEVTPAQSKYEVIYYSGTELPRVEDVGGAQAGRSGRAGGREAHHPTQVIRVSRGESLREKIVDAPNLKLPSSDSAVANLLAYKAVPGPAPAEGLRSSLRAPNLPQMAAVAPSPEVQRERLQSAPSLTTGVIAPPPTALQRELSRPPLPGANAVQVVPPPVSAPERISSQNARLTLPSQAVVAPPPQISREISPVGPGFGPGDYHKQVVPPPVDVGKVTGQRTPGVLGSVAAVPPPVQLSAGGNSSARTQHMGLGGNATVVPPPVQVRGGGSTRGAVQGLGGAAAVVPPPPSVAATGSLSGQGRGNRGAGFGGPGDLGAVSAPAHDSGGSATGNGVVVSSQPGSKVGVPGGGGAGALAMSPAGGSQPGLGGSGGGESIGRGNGPGSGFSGDGSGAGRDGTGRGSDPSARGGISPYPGSGGAGNGNTSKAAVPGVSVSGGSSNIITLPSFGGSSNSPSGPSRSSVTGKQAGPGITVVATSRSGGAFNFYGALKGDKVYTIYIETSLGTTVMQYADPTSTSHAYAEDLIAPQPLRAELPAGLPRSRLVIACILDRSGMVKQAQVLETTSAILTSKVLAALANWKFRPVLRGEQPVEVNAILGFNVDTSDRY